MILTKDKLKHYQTWWTHESNPLKDILHEDIHLYMQDLGWRIKTGHSNSRNREFYRVAILLDIDNRWNFRLPTIGAVPGIPKIYFDNLL